MSRDGTALFALTLAALLLLTPSPGTARKLNPLRAAESVSIEISGKRYDYFPLRPDGVLTFEADGPSVFEAILRWRFEGSTEPVDVEVEVSLDGSPPVHQIFRARAGTSSYPDLPGAAAGRPERIELGLRSGRHAIEVRLVRPREGVLDVNAIVRAPGVLPWRIDWRGAFGVTYDSNIFRYSDSDVEDFLDGRRPDRYTFEALDDLRLEPGVELALVREEPDRRSTEIAIGAEWRLATVNGEKSFSKLRVRFREERTGTAYLAAEYSAIPKYHLRRLWDADWEGEGSAYRSCDFRKNAIRLDAGSDRSLPIDVAVFGRYESYAYDPDFVEYDSDALTVGVRGIVRPAHGLRLDLGYALRRLEARGYDELGESRLTSDDSDTTYDQDEYEIRARWEAGRWWGRPSVLSARVKHSRRFYLAEKSAEDDPYHVGREDHYWTLGARAALELTRTAGIEAFVEYRARTAESDFAEDIGERKDYTALRTGLRLTVEGVRFLD
jgi:hypothetical protein